ncbi:6-phosphofructokinase 1 [Ruminococcus sp. YE71]|uniref:6-phosphofructokinase n=1 Tax=unclassified Ruminococcus TaxID=2608920 RepID=UPI000887F8E3|nr:MULTISPECIES: 6-phosphofructokinase [unclassified Ruminococcus]SDA29994.1 6-phosphofructokinase 1 [Ruminococcus sp. YE78]SFW49080.1 6-phosphofructokinase 1 [Ruminococcus sp. YE71]
MNIVIAQSGGPTCAINASLVGVFRQALKTPEIDAVFGSRCGIEGIIKDELLDLKRVIRTNEDMELLRQTPSTVLGSCRFKLPPLDDDSEVQLYEKIFSTLDKHRIEAFFYIGGNDSMDTVQKLSEYAKKIGSGVRFIGVPKTIDNDLPVTDHTPGFGSAAKYVTATVQEIIRDSSVYSIDSITIIEIMGRHAGWLTASTCVLRANDEIAPHLIYLPECEFSAEKFLEDVRAERAKHMALIVAVSEGVELKDGDDMRSGAVDNFGHKYLSGIGKALEQLVRDNIGCKVRSIELNVMQRCSSHICSKTDIDEAEAIGAEAVKAAMRGETGRTMVFHRLSDKPYVVTIESADTSLLANKEKFFPREWINSAGNGISDEAIKYFLPLIQGEVNIAMRNGMPLHFKLK